MCVVSWCGEQSKKTFQMHPANDPSNPTTTVKIVVHKLAKQNLSKGLCVGAHELLY